MALLFVGLLLCLCPCLPFCVSWWWWCECKANRVGLRNGFCLFVCLSTCASVYKANDVGGGKRVIGVWREQRGHACSRHFFASGQRWDAATVFAVIFIFVFVFLFMYFVFFFVLNRGGLLVPLLCLWPKSNMGWSYCYCICTGIFFVIVFAFVLFHILSLGFRGCAPPTDTVFANVLLATQLL